MKTALRIALAAALSLLIVSPALAQDGPKTKEIIFDDDIVQGDIHDANTLNTKLRERGELANLVRSRADFVDQLMSEVEDLGD
ncbi:MAG: hypothetical protein AUK47_22605 [Deltaproteobacteria bacterium CG2_30_63_29]|nr:MAG: hypothetical protein AUK47_22605 [Deltaproteobacteria bacterium CG2_30_63_29]